MHNAQQVIETLRSEYSSNRFQFDFNVSMYIAGDSNKTLRQEIIKLVTGEKRPLTKCGMHAVSDLLKAKFEQHTLF